jgi:hypothetical protein
MARDALEGHKVVLGRSVDRLGDRRRITSNGHDLVDRTERSVARHGTKRKTPEASSTAANGTYDASGQPVAEPGKDHFQRNRGGAFLASRMTIAIRSQAKGEEIHCSLIDESFEWAYLQRDLMPARPAAAPPSKLAQRLTLALRRQRT